MQEILLAGQIIVFVSHPVAGIISISWENMCSLVRHSSEALEILNVPPSALSLVQEYGTTVERSLYNTITSFSGGYCQDPRDKVYGLMGLIQESDRFTIDYRKSEYEVFVDVIRAVYTMYARSYHDSRAEIDLRIFDSRAKVNRHCNLLLELSLRMNFSVAYHQSSQVFLESIWYYDRVHKEYVGNSRYPPTRQRPEATITTMGFHYDALETCNSFWWYLNEEDSIPRKIYAI